MEIKISNPDNIPWWLVFEMLEEVAYQYPDFSKVIPYKAQFGRELKTEVDAIVTKATKKR
jgi:hypothetical protein